MCDPCGGQGTPFETCLYLGGKSEMPAMIRSFGGNISVRSVLNVHRDTAHIPGSQVVI